MASLAPGLPEGDQDALEAQSGAPNDGTLGSRIWGIGSISRVSTKSPKAEVSIQSPALTWMIWG